MLILCLFIYVAVFATYTVECGFILTEDVKKKKNWVTICGCHNKVLRINHYMMVKSKALHAVSVLACFIICEIKKQSNDGKLS